MVENYPLEQLVIIKKKKLEEAEKILREKKAILEQEEDKLKNVERERDKVKEHKEAKLAQLREELDKLTSTSKIGQMKSYLKVVQEELKKKEHKVKEQKKKVEEAENEVEIARKNRLKKERDVEKLDQHRKEWQKELYMELEKKEALESDEMGSARHTLKKQEEKRKK